MVLQPQRAVLLVRLAGRDEPLDRRIDAPVGVERALEVIVVEADAERVQVAILLLAQFGDRETADRLDVAEVVADLGEIALRELADVFAAVPVLGKRRVLAEELLRARAHRDREILDLLAGVVVVELARHVGALPLEQARERVAERRLTAVADVQRSRSDLRRRTRRSRARRAARRCARTDRARRGCARPPPGARRASRRC